MIVKNESHVIERCLHSALRWLDTWCIVDTGSTDDTMGIIRKVAKGLGKPGILYERPWVNFGHNRTEALTLAKDHMDWIFMMDADDTLDGTPPALSDLSSEESGYKVVIHHGSMRQQRPHIFNARFAWSYIGAVHEYAHCAERTATRCLPDTVWITARTEGFRSLDGKKFERDAALLEDHLATGSADVGRTLFYLAQSYRDGGNHGKAKEVYKRRAETQGWIEETYVAYVSLIQLSHDLREQLDYAWKAQTLLPTRREAVYEVLSFARRHDKFTQEVYALGTAYRNEPLDTGHLFVNTLAYGWSYDDELSIIAYYTQHYMQCYESARRALDTCPELHRARIQDNVRFASEKLKTDP